MRVLRAVFGVLLFVAAVFVASANVHNVELFYLPNIDVAGWPELRSVELPLFLIVLSFLTLGVILGGLAAILQQVALRAGMRRAGKLRDRALKDKAAAEALLDTAQDEANDARAELAEVKAELERARREASDALIDDDEPLSAFVEAAEPAEAESPAPAEGEDGSKEPERS